ncbi:MAG: nucleotide exchange factor GrpE, partial [Phaeodactylibacter sp.]|nr:nucleotide exchange factor GrpE [Phaeodactylibacter sp.]
MTEKEKKESIREEEQAADEVAVGQEEAMENEPETGAAEEQEHPEGLSLEEEFNNMKANYSELKDKYLRLFAEFDNFKKRTIREKMEMMKTAAQDTMSALLPVLDDFDRARKAAAESDKSQLFEEGIGLVYQKLYNILKMRGLEPVEPNGELFDPELHEAFTEIPAPSEEMKGRIVDT